MISNAGTTVKRAPWSIRVLLAVVLAVTGFTGTGFTGTPARAGGSAPGEEDGAGEKKRPHILFFTKSSGYEHAVVKRKGGELAHAEKVVIGLGKKHGFDVTASKDGTIFDGDLSKFDAFFFYTSGDLAKVGGDGAAAMSSEGKKHLLAAVAAGKGFLGSHCACDSFHSPGDRFENQERPDPYIAMIGGEFIRHGPQQKARMRVADPRFPGLQGLGEGFDLHEEWYSMKNFAPDLHVLLVQETAGMKGSDYQRPPYPATWVRKHGEGRVFYTSMGHRADVWTNPVYQNILLGGISWTLGKVDAEISPNLTKATPQASTTPPKPGDKK